MTLGPCHLWSAPRDYSRVPNVRHFYLFHLPNAAKGEVNTALYADEDDSKSFGAVKCARDCEAPTVHSIKYGELEAL